MVGGNQDKNKNKKATKCNRNTNFGWNSEAVKMLKLDKYHGEDGMKRIGI